MGFHLKFFFLIELPVTAAFAVGVYYAHGWILTAVCG